jgi:hypothetical protein
MRDNVVVAVVVVVVVALGYGYLDLINKRDDQVVELMSKCRTDEGREAWAECVRGLK